MMHRTTPLALILALAATLGGCAATAPAAPTDLAAQAPSTAATTPEEIVSQQSKAYWNARISANVEAAYAFTSPSYRAVHSFASSRLKYGAPPAFGEQEIVKVECEPDRCKVTSRFQTFTPLVPNAKLSVAKSEVWLREQDKWWVFVE